MPYFACPNCGSSVSSAVAMAPLACPGCCATMHPVGSQPPGGTARRPKPVVRMPLGSDPHAPSAARHALSELRGELGDARYRVCELLVSELVTNVVVHTSPSHSLAAADMRVRLYGDREKLIHVLHRLVDAGNTVVVVEHNRDVMAEADWIIDMGPEAGAAGGKVVVAGPPAAVAREARSHTGAVLKDFLRERRTAT